MRRSRLKRLLAFGLSVMMSLSVFEGLPITASAATTLEPSASQKANSTGYPEIFEPELWSKIESQKSDRLNVCENNSEIQSAISFGAEWHDVFPFQIETEQSVSISIPKNDSIYLIGDQSSVNGPYTLTVSGVAVLYGSDFSDWAATRTSSRVTVKSGGVLVLKDTELSSYSSVTVEDGGVLYILDSDTYVDTKSNAINISCSGFLSIESSYITGHIYTTASSTPALSISSTGYVDKLKNVFVDRINNSGYINLMENTFISLGAGEPETTREFGGLTNNVGGKIQRIVGGAIRGTKGLVNNGSIGSIKDVMFIQATGIWRDSSSDSSISSGSPAITTTSPIEFEYTDGAGTLLISNINSSSIVDSGDLVLAEGNELVDMIPESVVEAVRVCGYHVMHGGGFSGIIYEGGSYGSSSKWKGLVIGDANYTFATSEGQQHVYDNLTVDRVDSSKITLKWADLNTDPNHLKLSVWQQKDYDLKYGVLPVVWEKKSDAWYGAVSGLTPGKTYSLGVVQYSMSNVRSVAFVSVRIELPDFEDATITTPTKSANPESPVAPTLDSRTDTSITLTAQDGYEYSSNGGSSYQDSPTFAGLSEKTKYSFVQRIKENDTYLASAASSPVDIYTQPTAPSVPVLSSKTDTTIEVTVVPGQEYRIDDGEWSDTGLFESLTPNKQYSITTRFPESGEIPASGPSSPLTVTTDKSVSSEPGEITLTTTDTTISIDSKGETYEYKLDKVHTEYQDEASFDGLSPETEYTITYRRPETETHQASVEKTSSITTKKAAPATPEKPVLESKTDTTITIKAVPGCEYSKDGTHWQDENVFTGLTPNTSYDIYVRTKAEENQMEGQSVKESFKTKNSKPETPVAPTVQSKTDVKVILTPDDTLEYSKDKSHWQDSNEFNALTPDTEYTFYVRVKETDDTMPSDVSEGLTVRTKQESPSLDLEDLEVQSKTDTTITVTLPEGYEVKVNEDGLYQTSGEFTDLTPDTDYDIIYRLKETEDSMASNEHSQVVRTKKASENAGTPQELTLKSKTDTTVTLNVPKGQEVKLVDGDVWQDSGEFLKLTPNTEYNFVTRIKETDDSMASAESSPFSVTTKKAASGKPSAPVLSDKTDTTITIQAVPGQEYKLNDGAWDDASEFIDLDPDTEYKIYTRVKETGDQMASEVSDPLVVTTKKDAANALPGIVEKEDPDGNIIVTVPDGTEVDNGDETLPAGDHDITPNHKEDLENHRVAAPEIRNKTDVSFEIVTIPGFEYEVYKNDEEVKSWTTTGLVDGLSPATEYKVRARYAETEETMPSTPSDWTMVTTKNSAPSAPSKAPEVLDKTDTTITIKTEPGYEYKIFPDGEWTTNGTFENLDPNKSYEIVSRVQETDDTMPSENGPALNVTTKQEGGAAPEDALTIVDRTNTSITVEVPEGYEVKLEDGDYQTSGEFTDLEPDSEYTIIYRVAETDDAMPSAEASQKVSTKKDPVSVSETAALSLVDKTDTTITLKVPEGQEVKLSTASDWQDSGEFAGLTAGTKYSFDTRVKETDTQVAGEVLTGFEVTTKRDKDHVLNPDDFTDDNTLTPPGGTEVSVDGGSHWTSDPVDVSDVEKDQIKFRAKQPELESVTDISATVKENDLIEYSIDNGKKWQIVGEFTDLTPDTDYEIFARIKETEDSEPSDKSEGLAVKTLKVAPEAPVDDLVILDRTDTSIEFELIPGYEIKLSDGQYQKTGLFESLNPGTEYTFVYRIAQTSDTMASGVKEQTVSTKKSGAAQAETKSLALIDKTDTTVTLDVPAGQEVKLGNDGSWQDSGEFDALTPNTRYEFITRVKETDDQEPGVEVAGFFVVTKRDSDHVLNPDDHIKDNTLTPPGGTEVSVDGGSHWTSDPVDVSDVEKDDILFRAKKPDLLYVTNVSIAVKENELIEYSINDGTSWQIAGTFTDLTPETEYSITARIKETENNEPSVKSEALSVKTLKTAPESPVDSLQIKDRTDTSIEFELIPGYEIKLDSGEYQETGLFDNLKPGTEYTFTYRIKGSDDTMPSETKEQTVSTKKSGAAQTETKNLSLISKTDVTITLEVPEGQEVRLASDDAWQTSGEFDNLTQNTTYEFVTRVKETDDQEPGAEVSGFFVTTKRDSKHAFDPDDLTDEDGILTPPDGSEVSVDNGLTWTDEPVDVTDVDKNDIVFRPKKPELESKTDTTIVLVANENVEYSKEPGKYQSENTFTGLTPGSSYEIVTRFPETEESMPSEPSEALVVVTKKTAEQGMGDMTTVTPDEENPDHVNVDVPGGIEVSVDDGETWTDEDMTDIPEQDVDDMLFRVKAPEVESVTTDSVTLVAHEHIEYGMETESGYDWNDDGQFTNLSASTDYTFVARFKETDDYMSSNVSEPTLATTKANSTPLPTPDPEPEEIQHNQYLYGYPGNKMMPEANLTRAEAAALLYRLSDFEPVNATGTFSDVSLNHWAVVDIETLAANGVIAGYEDGTFRPSEKITRAEFVTLVVNLYNAHHIGAKMITSAHDFTDLSQDHWAWNFIQQGVDYQWLSGYEDSTFRPDNNIIRAEAIVVLNRMLDRGNCEHLDGLENPWVDLSEKAWYYDDIIEATVSHKFV